MRIINTPRQIDLNITSKCNMRCEYCSHFSSATDVQKDISTDEWLKFFEELQMCKVLKVTISGGEPFIREDFIDILKGIVKNKMRFNILSNGTLINENIVKFISETKRCDGVQVSIDGSHSKTHDVFRGLGSFEKAIEGIHLFQKYNINVSVRVTLHKENVYDLPNIAKLLLINLKLPSFSTNSASHMGLCIKNEDKVKLTMEQHIFAIESIKKLNKIYNNKIVGEAGPYAELNRWIKMEQALKEKQKPFLDGGYLKGCNGINIKLAVRADGMIVPCIQLCDIELGKINDVNLKDVWHNHPEMLKLRTRSKIPLSSFSFCKGCPYIPYCTGNCPAIAYNYKKEANHPSPDSCLKLFLENGGILPL